MPKGIMVRTTTMAPPTWTAPCTSWLPWRSGWSDTATVTAVPAMIPTSIATPIRTISIICKTRYTSVAIWWYLIAPKRRHTPAPTPTKALKIFCHSAPIPNIPAPPISWRMAITMAPVLKSTQQQHFFTSHMLSGLKGWKYENGGVKLLRHSNKNNIYRLSQLCSYIY